MKASEVIEQLKEMNGRSDPEISHGVADELIIQFLKEHDDPECNKVAEAYEVTRDMVGFWYA